MALAGIVALFTLFIVAWRFGTEERQPQSPLLTTISSPDLSQPSTTTSQSETDTEGIGNPMTDPAMTAKASEPPKPKHVTMRVDVEGGDSWLRVVHTDGTLVFDRTIVDGEKTFAVKGHGKQGFTIAGAGVPAYVTVVGQRRPLEAQGQGAVAGHDARRGVLGRQDAGHRQRRGHPG